MKKWLLLLLAISVPAFAQYSTTVSGNVKTISPNLPPNTNGSYVEFTLVNCGNNTPMVNGVAVLLSGPVDFFVDATGAITAAANSGVQPALYGNDAILCGASQTSRYSVRYFVGGIATGPAKFYYVASNVPFNLSTAQAITLLPPLVYPNTTMCPPGSYSSGINRDLSVQCRNLPSGANDAVVTDPVATQEIGNQPLILDGPLTLNDHSPAASQLFVSNYAIAKNPTGPQEIGPQTLTLDGDLFGQNGTFAGEISASCPIVKDATHFCISKFNGSNRGLVTTTGSFAVGTSGTVASCSTFLAGQGVFITGAGAGGNYVGTVVSCTGTSMVVTPATSTLVSSVLVQHDESAAFQAAITSLASSGGTIYLPDGWYLVNGPLQDTSHANAVIKLPNINYGASATLTPVIVFKGFTPPSTVTQSGAIIFSSIASGNVFGAYNPGSSGVFLGFTNYWMDFDNITFRAPHNPGMVMMNLTNAVGARVRDVRCDTGISGDSPLPTTTTSGCVYFPIYGNNVNLASTNLTVAGYANAVWAYEHADIDRLYMANVINGLIPDSGFQGTIDGPNTIRVGYFWCQICTNQVAAGVNPQTVMIDVMDVESVGAFGIKDPSNLLHGQINYLVNGFGGVSTPTNPQVSGGANLCLNNIKNWGYSQNCPLTTGQGVPTISAGAAAGSGAVATLISGSNDKSGTIQLVTGASGLTTNGQLIIMTLQNGRRQVAVPVLTPANLVTPGAGVWVSNTTTANNNIWNINSGNAALTASTTYKWDYTSGGFN